MKTGSRFLLLTVTMLMVLVFSAMLTVPAYADNIVPPPTETPTEVTPPVDESVPADPAPVVEETAPAADILAQIPEGTDVMVVNTDGEVLPLATEEAAQALADGDPMWCPVGVAPSTLNPVCSGAFTGISNIGSGTGIGNTGDGSLAHWLDINDPAKAGVIWIEYNYDGWNGEIDNTITLNGLDFANLDNFALTIQGGWNGTNGSTSLDGAQPYSTIKVPFTITGWTGAITIKNIHVTQDFLTDTTSSAMLDIATKGNIALDTVNVVDNVNLGSGIYDGAFLDNTSGSGTVTIKNSTFNNNEGYGLMVNSAGTITLSNVKASDNGGNGAQLDNSSALTAKNVILTSGINEFNGNGNTGLIILSHGAIILKDITANDNGVDGLNADNHLAGTAQAVTLSGTNVFSGNDTNGLVVNSRGAITVSNLVANNNRNGWGADLNNTSATTALAVKVTGNNEFKYNGGGLQIQSQGAISTNNVTALTDPILFPGNNDGVRLQNHYNYAANVTMTGTNIITGNFNNGLYVTSKGSITLNNITASGNENGYGAYLDNSFLPGPMAVLLSGTNTFNNNYFSGLEIHTNGMVTLNKVTANGNRNGYGTEINSALATLPKTVTLNFYGVFNNNAVGGLNIYTKGAITLNNVTANNNIIYDNSPTPIAIAGGVGVKLNNIASTSAFPQNVTINGTNEFSGNFDKGLEVSTFGVVLLSNLTANGNHGNGAYIGNDVLKSVTLNGYGIFNNNYSSGLSIYTKGAITLNNVTANNNKSTGAVLNNEPATGASPQNVTINGTNFFNNNESEGLDVSTFGAIVTNNLTANNNQWHGVVLFNWAGQTSKPVTLNGINTFNGNQGGGIGLYIKSSGAIKVNQLDANDNLNVGAWLDIDGVVAVGNGVTLTGSVYVDGNDGLGLLVQSLGAITITNLNINGLGGGCYQGACDGVSLTNVVGDVTISGTSQIFDRVQRGLVINTNGSVVLSNMTVSENGLSGIYITAAKNVTLTGSNYFYNNGQYGLYIAAGGAITLNNLDVYGNLDRGVDLSNCGPCDSSWLAPKGITITGTNFFVNNGSDGLHAESMGAITISNITANFNGVTGANLNNQKGAGSVGGITLTGLNIFKQNDLYGLLAESNGAITISNLLVDLNKSVGVELNNHSVTGATGAAVTLTGVNTFTNNDNAGLRILSGGQITLSNVTATGNKASGAFLDNRTYASLLLVKPGIKLTGVNTFNQNLEYGLTLISDGVVDLINVTADQNGSDGLHANTIGNFTLACASLNNNAGNGWDVVAGGLITLKGVYGFGNPSGNIPSSPSASVIVIRTCSVPAPVVVIQIVEDEERAAGGAKVKDALVYERK